MLDIEKRIQVINDLLDEGTDASLTYAALECRLTIEYVCYERFKMFYAYLSEKDLTKWAPKHVVKQVCDDISKNIDCELTLSISKISGELPTSIQDFESLDYKKIGTQKSLKLNKLHSLWHSLSNLSLHLPIPTIHSGHLSIYGDTAKVKKKIKAVLDILSDLKEGNLLMGGVIGKTISFQCEPCGIEIKKPVSNLKSGDVISCITPNCDESYLVETEESDFVFTRNVFDFECPSCAEILYLPHQTFSKLTINSILNIKCYDCSKVTSLIMRPMIKCE